MKTIGADPVSVIYDTPSVNEMNRGLSKREYFAARAMQGILSNPDNMADREAVCKHAVKMADGLIEELNKSEE